MWILLPLLFMTGVLTRIADMIADDGLKLNRYVSYATGIAYGFLIAYVIRTNPALAELGIAVILSVIITGKIDHPVHCLGVSSMLFFLAIYGINPLNPALLVIFILGAAADELGNNLADENRIRGGFGHFLRLKLTMEAVAFLASAFTGLWIIFLAILIYDAGYTYIFTPGVRRRLLSIFR
jgi:hypothetical protein